MSLVDMTVAAGDSGPIIFLAGEADNSSATQLNEVLAAQVSAQTGHLTIDLTNLWSADPATAQALMLAALIVKVRSGNVMLLNLQEPAARVLDHPRTAETFTIRVPVPAEVRRATSRDGHQAEGSPGQ